MKRSKILAKILPNDPDKGSAKAEEQSLPEWNSNAFLTRIEISDKSRNVHIYTYIICIL